MPDITLRNARTTIENYIVDQLYLAYGVRLPAAADPAALRLLASVGLADRSLRFLSSASRTYQWKRFETAADDGVSYIKPADVSGANPGRWVKTSSTIASGYLKRADLYNDDSGDIDIFEQRLFGQVPAMLLSFEDAEHHPKSTEKGALYWAVYSFTLFAVSVDERGEQTARQGSQLASEVALDPGTAAMIGDAKSSLAGSDLGLNDVAYIEIGNESPVVRDQAKRRFVESLDLKVYATLTNPDTDTTVLQDPYEFNVQYELADVHQNPVDLANYVAAGMWVPLGGSLTQTITGGTIYVGGTMVSAAGVVHSFGANTVTYRDINASGTYTFLEGRVGEDAPGVTANSIRVGVTVTDSSGVRLDRILADSLINYGPFDQVVNPQPAVIISGVFGMRRVINQPGDGSDFFVVMPVTMPNDTYTVVGTQVNGSGNVVIECPDSAPSDRTTTQFRVVTSAPLATGDSIDFLVSTQ